MTNRILIVEDDSGFAAQWKELLTEFLTHKEKLKPVEFMIEVATGGSTYEEAYNLIAHGGGFDLVLLDHHLEPDNKGFTGIDLIRDLHEELGENVLRNRFVILSAVEDVNVSDQYTRLGSLAFLIKPINRNQFFITISDAWIKQQLGVARAEWEKADEAIQFLIEEGLLEPLDQLSEQVIKQREQAEALQQLNTSLLDKLTEVGEESDKFRAFYEWDEGIKRIAPSSIASILPELSAYKVTKPFLRDLEYFFNHNMRVFIQLHADLAQIRKLGDAAKEKRKLFDDHWEHRIGIKYRLYFRSSNEGKILERFAHHNIQEEVLKYLRSNNPEIIENHERFFDSDSTSS